MQNEMLEQLLNYPIIAAVKNEEGLNRAITSPCQVIFVLYGDVCTIGEITQKIKQANKLAIVHIDLVDGLSNREISVQYLKKNTMADGIISTKSSLIHCAKQLGFITVQRFFLLDSMSLENVTKHLSVETPDFIEILPGAMPKITKLLTSLLSAPVIAGGLIRDKEDVVSSLSAGATAVSTTNCNLWFE